MTCPEGVRILRPQPSAYADWVRSAAAHFKRRVDRITSVDPSAQVLIGVTVPYGGTQKRK
jgi:hypothetical protein